MMSYFGVTSFEDVMHILDLIKSLEGRPKLDWENKEKRWNPCWKIK